MKKLVEKLGVFLGVDPLMEGAEFDQAKAFIEKGILPDGDKWSGGKPSLTVGFDGDIIMKRVKRKEGTKETLFTFDMELRPGKGGGSGATISAAASNHYFNLAGTESASIKGMKVAFEKEVKGSTRELGSALHKWFSDSDNWLWRVVGWGDRNSWSKPKVKIRSIRTSGAMIDPTRRKWPSGRTEVWVPLLVSVQAEARKK
jgi:hypothetical protein